MEFPLRNDLIATKSLVEHQQEKKNCGRHDHSNIDHTTAGFTGDI